MIQLERVNPSDYSHLDRYVDLLEGSRNVPDVADHLPEIFEEGSAERIRQVIHESGAMRFFVVVDRITVGRIELTRHLNGDPSILPLVPEGVDLGYNTCYFINPALVGRNVEDAHRRVADASILRAFAEGDEFLETAPWLPVAAQCDASRGWLMQTDNPAYTVHVGEPSTGIFPQFGIGDNAYSIAYATPSKAPEE